MQSISGIWGWVPAIGGLILAIVLFWAMMKNRKSPPSEIERSERGARELREKLDAQGEDAQSPHS